ncbi:MAG: hypothetical protein ACMZI0_13390 [Symbiopectobacterium sp.]|uniref:hypothetical protein n=1 Tax=Symbiopectobacterium sp. TaxID=2952789 RepID=UPI0039E8F783
MWNWLKETTTQYPANAPSVSTQPRLTQCNDCEYSFFNHDAMLPFDHLNECQCNEHSVNARHISNSSIQDTE